MRALYLEEGQLTLHNDYLRPEVGADEALIRVSLAGICSADLELIKGYAGGFRGVLGHEFVGVVEAAGSPAAAEWVGRRVVGGINLGCGRCAVCLGEGPEHCPNRTTLGIHHKDGVFADYVTLPVVNLLQVPDRRGRRGGRVHRAVGRGAVHPRTNGRVADSAGGCCRAGAAGAAGGSGVGPGWNRGNGTGAADGVAGLPRELGLATGLVDEAADNSYGLVVEATGNDAGFAHSMRLVRPRGTLVLKSTFHGNANINLTVASSWPKSPLSAHVAGCSRRRYGCYCRVRWRFGRSSRPSTHWLTPWPPSPTRRSRARERSSCGLKVRSRARFQRPVLVA